MNARKAAGVAYIFFFFPGEMVTILQMRSSRVFHLFIALTLAIEVTSCGRSNRLSLRARILAANTSQYCVQPDACSNPSILALETGLEVTTFHESKPTNVQVPANDLARYLQALPMQAWPRGPAIILTLSDDVTDEKAIEQNLAAARQVCQSLGLDVEFRPGG